MVKLILVEEGETYGIYKHDKWQARGIIMITPRDIYCTVSINDWTNLQRQGHQFHEVFDESIPWMLSLRSTEF